MELKDDFELANTRQKLTELQARYDLRRLEIPASDRLRQMTLTSLKKLINQLTEEIARYECRQHDARPTPAASA